MKILLALFITLILAFKLSVGQDTTYSINGKLEKIKKGLIVLHIYQGDKTLSDSSSIKNGSFHFTGNIHSPYFASLTIPGRRKDYFTFYIEPVSMDINGRGDSLQLLVVKGSGVNDDDKLLRERMNYISKWQQVNSELYEKAYKEKNKKALDSLGEVDNDVLGEKRKVVLAFVKENPHSMRGAMAIIENYGYYAEADEIKPVYDLLDQKIKDSEKGKEIQKLLDVYNSVAVGRMAPEIEQETPEGNILNLGSLRGKYVLVDFWASWCGPCRRENPKIVEAYNKFKNKGFEVFGVSYDTKKDKWIKAIADDRLNWSQVSDFAGLEKFHIGSIRH